MCKCTPFNVEEIRQTFRYENGRLYRLIRVDEEHRQWKALAGTWKEVDISKPNTGKGGYVQVWDGHRMLKVHRVIYALVHGDFDQSLVIDHIDGNTLNNDPDNLELKSQLANTHNRKRHREGRLVGASYREDLGKWRAMTSFGPRPQHIGVYDTEEEANAAYIEFVRRLESGEIIETRQEKRRKAGRLKGSSWHKATNRWMSYAKFDGKQHYLGLFDTEQEAHEAHLAFCSSYEKEKV